MTRVLLICALSQSRLSLPEGADTNDWKSYQQQGLREIDRHPARALQYFDRAAQLDPSVAEPLLGRYAAWWRMHSALKNRFWHDKPTMTDSALATERWLDEADPDYAVLYFNRALCLEQLGRTDEARQMHREFVARAPRRMKPLIQQSEAFLNRNQQ